MDTKIGVSEVIGDNEQYVRAIIDYEVVLAGAGITTACQTPREKDA